MTTQDTDHHQQPALPPLSAPQTPGWGPVAPGTFQPAYGAHSGLVPALLDASLAGFPFPVVARFHVPDQPVVKERPRTVQRGRRRVTITPDKTLAGEAMVAWRFRMENSSWQVDAESRFGILARFANADRVRRDVDNLLKLVMDGLNGVCWKDDHQVDETLVQKWHAGKALAGTDVVIYLLP